MSCFVGLMMLCCAGLPAWEFDDPASLSAWAPNAQLTEVSVQDGVLSARATDWDPFFSCRTIEFPAGACQYVVIRMRADRAGEGELFWSGSLEGQYGGLSQDKSTRFSVPGDNAWHEIVLFPFWQAEGTIRQLRFDVYDAAKFGIDYIRIADWSEGRAASSDTYAWRFENGDTSAWRVHPAAQDLFAPVSNLDVSTRGWVTLHLSAKQDAQAAVLWASNGKPGVQSEPFALRGDGKVRAYNVEVGSYPSWKGNIAAFGVRLPEAARAALESVSIAEEPSGPPDFTLAYFGFENGANRAGRPCRVMAQFVNHGGTAGALNNLRLELPPELTLVNTSGESTEPIDYAETGEAFWEVKANAPGTYEVRLPAAGDGAPETATARLRFLPPVDTPAAPYVPEPRPVKTGFDICAYYFPGWNADTKWDCIRRVAPIRKPLLGYYDEAKVECVDWQIKWAVENGVNCFLVDWYWVGGNQHLTHWFDAYRQAKYRDMLQVAIMWANHNPPKTHSREDWRKVTQEWIDRYFNLPAYYKLNGKPAIFLWNPEGLRNDLGGAAEAKAALDESQAMARAAGYAGIEFVAVNGNQSPALIKILAEEGYSGVTNYHEWGKAVEMSKIPNRAIYDDIADTVVEKWERRDSECAPLTYYPLVDTGWDSRPWHGDKSLVISGRTPEAFERMLRAARAFSEARASRMIVLGPVNEWGEGSYIEPNTEFDFDMYEALRRVFAQGDAAAWPVNLSPADLGLGPYDFPPQPPAAMWEFDNDAGGWAAMMGVADLRCEEGQLRFRTTSGDPALVVGLNDLRAAKFPRATLRMRIEAAAPAETAAQLFWSVGGGSPSEATSATIPLIADGAFHDYAVDLKSRPRWRGRIATLRFDPCGLADVNVSIDRFVLETE